LDHMVTDNKDFEAWVGLGHDIVYTDHLLGINLNSFRDLKFEG
jgi:hypothetical protein